MYIVQSSNLFTKNAWIWILGLFIFSDARCGPIHNHNIFFLDISVTISVMNSTACIILNIRQILCKHVPQHVLYNKKKHSLLKGQMCQALGKISAELPTDSPSPAMAVSPKWARYSRMGLKVTNKLKTHTYKKTHTPKNTHQTHKHTHI